MKNFTGKIGQYLLIFCIIYPFGVFLFLLFKGLRLCKILRIKNWERFPHCQQNMLVVANHPSIIDPIVLPTLFFWGFLQRPIKYGPVLVADANNFYNSWWFFWLRPFLICVKRGDTESENQAFFRIGAALSQGRIVIIFPEGRRTFKVQKDDLRTSINGKQMGKLKRSIGLLVRKTKAKVLTVWVEGTDKFFKNTPDRLFSWSIGWNTFSLIVGKLRHFHEVDSKKYDAQEITAVIEYDLLELADEI